VAHTPRDSPWFSTRRGQRTFPSEHYEDGHNACFIPFDSTLTSPLNAGHNFQTPNPPTLRYWPSDSSRKNIGIPAKNRVMTYGIRNAPRETYTDLFSALCMIGYTHYPRRLYSCQYGYSVQSSLSVCLSVSLSVCPRSKRKTALAMDTKLVHIHVYSIAVARCTEPEKGQRSRLPALIFHPLRVEG